MEGGFVGGVRVDLAVGVHERDCQQAVGGGLFVSVEIAGDDERLAHHRCLHVLESARCWKASKAAWVGLVTSSGGERRP